MPAFVVPYKPLGKTRLGDRELAEAMCRDVIAACARLGDVVVADAAGGQGGAVSAALARIPEGPVAIVNADLPCVTTAELEQLVTSAPSIVAARDGTTNAIALRDRDDFRPLYGPGSADRFERALGAARLDLSGLVDDVDNWDDLMRVADRVGPNTRSALEVRV
jgi:2-phospho-L-lactate guanylyltransferase (CobY/MobA/RfbA family)